MNTKRLYKKRLYLLLFGGLVFLLICYNLTFKKTISEIVSVKENNLQLASLQAAPLELQLLDKKLKALEGNLNYNLEDENNQEVLLLEKTTTLIKPSNLRITELPKTDVYSADGFIVKTQQIVIRGSFSELLTFLHSVERDQTLGNICSVDFYSQKDVKSGVNNLKMKIYFQTIIQDKQK
jgi:hypothetical protein